MTNKTKYIFSFTGASAMIPETIVIAEEYVRLKDWKLVEKAVFENNLLNKVKESTIRKQFPQIRKRLSALTSKQIQLISQDNLENTKAIILLALSKVYTVLHDFIVEVLRNKYQVFDYQVSETDFTKFFNSKSLSHPEVAQLKEVTAKKVRQVIFRFLVQVGLLTKSENGTLIKPVLGSNVIDAIMEENPSTLMIFFYTNEEIKSLRNKMKHAS